METFIYKSRKKEELYLYLAVKDDFSTVPEDLLKSIGHEPLFVMQLTLSEQRKLAREDVRKVMHNLQEQGFHLQMPPPVDLILQREHAGKPH
ncbi:MAG: YcgL domain-containing protein [Methylophaga sp.]|nr:YcgL domain-containing protein [Methylophaga sp.]